MTDRHIVTDELIRALAAGTEKQVGDREAPPDAEFPFYIVQAIPGGGTSGSLRHPDADVAFVYQVTSVGEARIQAEAAADRARDVVLGRNSKGRFKHAMSGISDRSLDSFGGDDGPEGELTRELFSSAERYVLYVLS